MYDIHIVFATNLHLFSVVASFALQGFMEDEGRQRTTKFISHKCVFSACVSICKSVMLRHISHYCTYLLTSLNRCVGVSDQLQLFAKEQERNKLLCSSAPQTSRAAPSSPTIPSASHQNGKTPATAKPQSARKGNRNAERAQPMCGDVTADTTDGELDREGCGSRRDRTEQTQSEIPVVHPTPAEGRYPSLKATFSPYLFFLIISVFVS